MQTQRTFQGLEFTLRSRGVGRFFDAGFLLLWLAFWVVGEGLVLWLLFAGARALITGTPPAPGRAPLELAPSLGVGLFLLVWVTFWTLGGVLAATQLLRQLWSRDRLLARADGLEITRSVAGFARRTWIGREELVGFFPEEGGPALMAETRAGTVELTRLATPVEKTEIAREFARELKLDELPAPPPALPEGWRELTAPEGVSVLVRDPVVRRRQARVAWLIALPVGAVAVVITRAAFDQPSLAVLAAIVVAAALALGWGAAWLSLTRVEWRLERGRIVQQRRRGARVRELFAGDGVRLEAEKDSDGDVWHAVSVVDSAGPAGDTRRSRRQLLRAIHEPVAPRRLAGWLAARTGVPLQDLTRRGEPKVDLATVASALETTGPVGRWLARRMLRARRKS